MNRRIHNNKKEKNPTQLAVISKPIKKDITIKFDSA